MTLAVFVPALMAVGLLVSATIVVADWVSGLFPSRSVWRKQQVARDALGSVSRIAASVDTDLRTLDIRRRVRRARMVYVGAAIVFSVLGVIVVRFGEDLYEQPLDLLYDNPWSLAIGYGVGGFLLVVAAVSLIPAVVTFQRGRVVRALVEHTWLGKPASPPEDPRELVRPERNPS
jgi:hypothetical protein